MASQPAIGPTTDEERSLSGALIGGAFGFVGIAIFASASYADKVESYALWWGNFIATLSVVALLLSIIFGGKGWSRRKSGAFSEFNIQAIFGLMGVLFLCVSAAIFAFNPSGSQVEQSIRKLTARIDVIERAKLETSATLPTHSMAGADHGSMEKEGARAVRQIEQK